MNPSQRSHHKLKRRSIHRAAIESLESRRLLSGGLRQMENLDRGVVALTTGPAQVYVGWRLLGTDDPATTAFDVYRSVNGGAPALVNTGGPITASTNLLDVNANTFVPSSYFVRPVISGVPQPSMDSDPFTVPPSVTASQYLNLPLQIPAGGHLPGTTDTVEHDYTYSPNDASVGDLDGDGQYEIILKWDPSDSKDNSQDGYTGNVILDAYKLDGTLMWRIDLGRNIRAGAHYTQFMVYDLDGDGRAEIAAKTAPGTKDGLGNNVILGSDDPNADYRNSEGYILSGPEYLTIFDGLTGANLATTNYIVPRGTVSAWGDSYGNRVDRFLACVAYLDGERPSLVMARGYYTRATLTAWDWRNGQLTQRWLFDSNTTGNSAYAGQGNHNLSVADVDADGKDEIIYGAATIDDNGTGLYSTGFGHGDALHVSDMDPSRPGLEVFTIHEPTNRPGADIHDAATGQVLMSKAQGPATTEGPGRGVAADIFAGNPGYEWWVAGGDIAAGLYDRQGNIIGDQPSSVNFLVWWDADPYRELLNSNAIDKYNPTGSDTRLLTATGASSINGTKSTPNLSGDILGDWREEVILRASDNSALRIYTTTILADTRMTTLMHDSQYRLAIAWQNVAYNQPPHPGFYLGGPFVQLPAAPTGLATTVAGVDQIDLTWIASPDAVSYNVKRSTASAGTYTTLASNLTGTSWTDSSATAGTTFYYVVSAVDGAALESVNSSPASGKVPAPTGIAAFQAESASVGGAGITIDSNHAGFNGTGFVNFPTTGGYVEWTNIDGGAGGSVSISFRYALGNTARTGSLVVNGVAQNITFASTTEWTNWTPHTLSVNLNPGATNTIRLNSTGQDLGNIDELQVSGAGDLTAPTISSPTHSYNTAANTLSFTFSEGVYPSLSKSDLVITLLGAGTSIAPTQFIYETGTYMATFTLPVSLADGNYRATFVNGGVIDSAGNALAAGYAFDFFVLAGDINHDRSVDVLDLVVLASNWYGTNKVFGEGDLNYDTVVNQADLGILAMKWQQKLEPPALPSAPAPTTARRSPTRTATRVIDLVQ